MADQQPVLTREQAFRLAFQRDSRVQRTSVGIRFACVEQTAMLLESWWRAPADGTAAQSFRWVANQTLSRVLLWQFSEAFSTNKYLGAAFWSEGAIVSLQIHAQATSPAWFKSQGLPPDDALVHEHVCERAALADWLLDGGRDELERSGRCERDVLATALTKLCVGCVVTHAEHRSLSKVPRQEFDWENPWRRYARAKTAIVPIANPRLLDSPSDGPLTDEAIARAHRDLIAAARSPAEVNK